MLIVARSRQMPYSDSGSPPPPPPLDFLDAALNSPPHQQDRTVGDYGDEYDESAHDGSHINGFASRGKLSPKQQQNFRASGPADPVDDKRRSTPPSSRGGGRGRPITGSRRPSGSRGVSRPRSRPEADGGPRRRRRDSSNEQQQQQQQRRRGSGGGDEEGEYMDQEQHQTRTRRGRDGLRDPRGYNTSRGGARSAFRIFAISAARFFLLCFSYADALCPMQAVGCGS